MSRSWRRISVFLFICGIPYRMEGLLMWAERKKWVRFVNAMSNKQRDPVQRVAKHLCKHKHKTCANLVVLCEYYIINMYVNHRRFTQIYNANSFYRCHKRSLTLTLYSTCEQQIRQRFWVVIVGDAVAGDNGGHIFLMPIFTLTAYNVQLLLL